MVKKRRLLGGHGSATKSRPREARSPQSGEEIISARVRFKGALQDLLPHSEGETESSDEELERWHSRSKRFPSLQKKPVEKQNDQEQSGFRQAFVMKLYDRSVDLAQFNEQTPLYPICRAWIANQPHQPYNFVKKKSPSPEPKEEIDVSFGEESDPDIVRDTYRLPPPDMPMSGNNKLRVPEVIPYHTKFNKFDQEGVEPPSREQLLQDNLAHWTKVRQNWLDASVRNELRYKNSFKIMLAIFNKAQKQF